MTRQAPLLGVVVLLLLVLGLEAGNDGLWYQGDSPRHFLNGVFWGDFLLAGDYLDPQGFAMDYYLRYPAIAPTIWPPFVYLVEAAAFLPAGPSIPLARVLIAGFAMLGGIYLVLVVRRWSTSPLGPWAAVLAVAQPVYLLWSNAVMMEIPALALGIASLYHLDRSRDASGLLHPILAAAFLWACTMTRLVGILVPASYGLILLLGGQWRWLGTRGRIATWAAAAVALVPWLLVNLRFGSIMVREATHLGEYSRWSWANWTYYPTVLPVVVGPALLALAGLGVLLGLRNAGSRRAASGLLGCMLVTWAVLSWVSLKEARYLIGILPFLAGGAALALDGIWRALAPGGRRLAMWAGPVVMVLLAGHEVRGLEVPRLEGMEEAVATVLDTAPGSRVLYEGLYDGVFIAYTRVHPRGEEWSVVRGSKVFYATALQARFGLVEHVEDAGSMEAIVRDTGCRWLVVEREEVVGIPAATRVREALVSHPRFTRLQSLPLRTHRIPEVTRLDIYEYTGTLGDDLESRLSFPVLEGADHGN